MLSGILKFTAEITSVVPVIVLLAEIIVSASTSKCCTYISSIFHHLCEKALGNKTEKDFQENY